MDVWILAFACLAMAIAAAVYVTRQQRAPP